MNGVDMKNQARESRSGWRNRILTAAGIVALAVPVRVSVLTAPHLRAQSAASQASSQSLRVAQWEVDAGGEMAFDVASVKLNKWGPPPSCPIDSNVFLVPGDTYSP